MKFAASARGTYDADHSRRDSTTTGFEWCFCM